MEVWRVGTFRDSAQEGLGHGAAVSAMIGCSFLWKRISTQSMILMMRCGGLPSLRTVAIKRVFHLSKF